MKPEKARKIFDEYVHIMKISELSGTPLSEESEFIKDMLAEHPQYVEDFSTGRLREGMNPRLHILSEAIVQRQIARNDPPEARQAHLALMSKTPLDAHEARHAVGRVLMECIWHMMREKWQPAQINSYYRKRLKELVTKGER